MTDRSLHPMTRRLLLGGGLLLWGLMAAYTVRGAVAIVPSFVERIAKLPTAIAAIGSTTCGTYAPDCGGIDCGLNQPFVESGQNDPDCDTPLTGNNVCHNGAFPSCLCQEEDAPNCSGLPGPAPQAPLAVSFEDFSGWHVRFSWWTNQATNTNIVHFIRNDPAVPDRWQCIWGGGCGTDLNFFSINVLSKYHTGTIGMPGGQDWWFGVKSVSPGLPELRSEIRSYRTYIEDFTIDATVPAADGDKIVTGETTQQYKVTITPIGGISGAVTLSVDNWSPAIAGQTINWVGGNTVNIAGPNPIDKFFTIGTDDGAPPTVPPVTLPDIYDFRIVGVHATAGTRTKDLANALTVMDYRMNPSIPQLTMDPTGDTDSFTVNFDWLPAGWQYNRQVDLTTTAIAGLNVNLSQTIVDQGVPSVTITLTTNGVAPNPIGYDFDVLGRGGPPGNLQRRARIRLIITNPPDFSLAMQTGSQTVPQGAAINNRVTVQSLFGFSEVVDLSATALQQGEAVPEPTIVITFNPPLPQPPPNGSIQSVVTANTGLTTPCAAAPGERYTVTVRGLDAAGGQPPNAARSTTYELWVVCAVPPSFTMSANPTTRTVTAGDATTYQITATSQNGFADTVVLDSPIIPAAGVTYTAPASGAVQPGVPWVFNFDLDTSPATPVGSYQITLPAHAQADPTITASVIVTLDVTGVPDYSFTVTPPNLALSIGGTGTYTIDVNSINGYSTPIRFTWSLDPANPNVGFNPASGNLVVVPGNSGVITVTASPGSTGTYFVNFTATPQGPGIVRNLTDTIQLTIGVAACTEDCPKVCVDQNNQPLVPEQQCSGDADCPANSRCAFQTCNGVNGCVPDPLAGPFDCNETECYDASGAFIIPPADPQCYQSWPRCTTLEVLKVRKDRQCNRWLSCEEAVTYEEPLTKKATTQCLSLGVCNQLGPTGECANFLPAAPQENQRFLTPENTNLASSSIRWYSGYSTDFHFTKVCEDNINEYCQKNEDCDPNGTVPCISNRVIESTYPSQAIEETGLDGATVGDLVTNGTFEEMRCDGGPRDGLSCIVTGDCRVGTGVCANQPTGVPTTVVNVGCTTKNDCIDARGGDGGNQLAQYCRFMKQSGAEFECENPVSSNWMGIVPPGANVDEAGFGRRYSDPEFGSDMAAGQKRNNAGDLAVFFKTWEDDENFQSVEPDVRHPNSQLWGANKHVKDGNNFLRVHVRPDADQFSGVGVPILNGLNIGGHYTVSFKARYIDNHEPPEKIKVQLAYNYEDTANFNFSNNNFAADDFEIVQGTGDIELPVSNEWQTFVLGPITVQNFNQVLKPFLNFVTNTKTSDKQLDTIFDIDDVTLKPVLDTAKTQLTATDTKKLERRCRLFPKNESPECDYLDENFTRYKGWKGYCLDKDPQNQNLCLTWWPLDLLAGETPFTTPQSVGYDGRSPLYYCMQAEGGQLLATTYVPDMDDDHDVHVTWQPPTDLHWRDIERVKITVDMDNSDEWGSDCYVVGDTAECDHNNRIYSLTLKQDVRPVAGTMMMGGFVHFGPTTDLETMVQNNNFNGWWNDNCENSDPPGGNNDQYIMAAVTVTNVNNPDDPAAKVDRIYVHICDDREGSIEDAKMQIAVYRRQSCNVISEVVQAPGPTGAPNKAWAVRTDQTSSYKVPDLNLVYLNEEYPFGAIHAPDDTDPPSLWDPTIPDTNHLSLALTAAEPRPTGAVARAGTPYSCRTQCSGNKYCYDPNLPNLCGGANCEPGPACNSAEEVTNCNNRDTGALCVGRPAGRCSANPLLACTPGSNECQLAGVGTCTLADATWADGKTLNDAADRLKRLFAKSYNCYQLRTQRVTVGTGWTRDVLQSDYGSCDAATAAAVTWDVMNQPNPYCPNNDRTEGVWPDEFCAVRPTVENFSLNGRQSGNLTIPVGQSVTGGFTYSIDAEQEPLTTATILWDFVSGQNQSDADDACEAVVQPTPETGSLTMSNIYDTPGTFKPVACVKDNWGAIRAVMFPGTVRVE